MENNKITVFLQGKTINVDYDIFINSFTKTYFFVKDINCIEKFLFQVLKIKEEDKIIIINSFKEEINKHEDYLKNNQNNEEYYDKLCDYLFHIGFSLLDKKHMELVLNNLNVSDYYRNKILQLFKQP